MDSLIDAATASRQQPTSFPKTAYVNWAAAVTALDTGLLPCASSEGQPLRIVASLAEGIPADLRDALSVLDAIKRQARRTGDQPHRRSLAMTTPPGAATPPQ